MQNTFRSSMLSSLRIELELLCTFPIKRLHLDFRQNNEYQAAFVRIDEDHEVDLLFFSLVFVAILLSV